jgi:hypothetical protein
MSALTKMAIHTNAMTFFALSLSFFEQEEMVGPNPIIVSMLCNIELFGPFWWFP